MARQSDTDRRRASRNSGTRRFGDWLRELRESRNVPIRVVAAAAEMDQAHLSKAELGQRQLTEPQMISIAKYFNVPPTEMEARWIANKFVVDHGQSQAAVQAVKLLNIAYVLGGGRS